MNPIELGKFIAKLRNEKHITQEELAEKLYIDKRKVSRWECGTSIPEFDMLIKLSEILDVSLYELSIGKRITNDKLKRRIINKFKTIKDFKKYKVKKIIKIVVIILVLVFFSIMTIYTFKYNNTIEIYELHSIDEKYYIEGNIIRIKNEYTINISKIINNNLIEKDTISNIECDYEIYSNVHRLFKVHEGVKEKNNIKVIDFKSIPNVLDLIYNDSTLTYKSACNNKSDFSFDFKLSKIYDNKLF